MRRRYAAPCPYARRCALRMMTRWVNSRPGRAGRRSSHFRYAPLGRADAAIMTDPTLILRRANASRISGEDEDYDVFDGEGDVARTDQEEGG